MNASIRSSRIGRGFTLIELLVVVSIIALLVGIMLPALSQSMRLARDMGCLANLRQIGLGWTMYMNDFDNFPVARNMEGMPRVPLYSWGGVHWYGEDAAGDPNIPFYLALADRPVNPYIGANLRQDRFAKIFRCPNDVGVRYSASNEMVFWTDFAWDNFSGEGDTSVYGMLGNSYQANDWMYCAIGAIQGIGRPPVNLRYDMGPADVVVSADRFVLVGDTGSNYAGRYDRERRMLMNIIAGWWHGEEQGQMVFLDGSARRSAMGNVVTERYSYYLDPSRHNVEGAWRRINTP